MDNKQMSQTYFYSQKNKQQIKNQQFDKNNLNNFNILIATDNHLGYKEKHPIRGNDSF